MRSLVVRLTSIALLFTTSTIFAADCNTTESQLWATSLTPLLNNTNLPGCLTDANLTMASLTGGAIADAQVAKIIASTSCRAFFTAAAALVAPLPNCTFDGVDYKAEFNTVAASFQANTATPTPTKGSSSRISATFGSVLLIAVSIAFAFI